MKHAAILAGLATVFCATSALAAKDNFDRATLGKHWVVPDGSLTIVSDQLEGSSLGLGYLKKSAGDTSVTALVSLTSTDLEYGAVASGDIAGGNNAFVKIQAQTGDGMFSNGGFYVGDNSGVDFFALDSEVPSPATISLSFCGTVATLKIKSAAGKQVYNFDYGTTYGTGGGLGTYGAVALDNYKSMAGGCAMQEKGRMITRGMSKVKDLSQK